jgi:hypothetical protein
MSKASGLFLVMAGAASLCAGFGMQLPRGADRQAMWEITGDDTVGAWAGNEWWRTEMPSVAQPEPKQGDIATVVVAVPHRKETTPKAATAPVKSGMPGDRVALTREVQRELRRVGCYDGEINGGWTPETRKAMQAFMSRVNAKMPVGQPDFILLALVQGHPDTACGIPCPAGQTFANDGRCLPSAVLAHAAKIAPPGPATGDAHSSSAIRWSSTTVAQPPLGDAAPTSEPRQAQANPVGATHTSPAQKSNTRRAAAPQPEFRQRTFGPDFLRRADAVGLY